MSRFVQSLESRTLFSAITNATIAADAKAIAAAGATARADLNATKALLASDAKLMAADLKPITDAAAKRANAALLKTLKADEARTLATLKADTNSLVNAGSKATQRAASDAKALLLKPTNMLLAAKVSADATALGLVSVAPLAKLQTDAFALGLNNDLANLASANPSSAPLATHVQNALAHVSTSLTTLTAAAGSFNTQLGTLETDAGATATIGTVVGSYNGSTRATSGSIGTVSFLLINITSQAADGSLAGNATFSNAYAVIPMSFAGKVTVSDAFTATLADPTTPGRGLALTGMVHRNVASGSGTSTVLAGTFVGAGGIDNGEFTIST